ncbi:hypothetical protein GCM10022204_25780 [Microlunatus aurantiacus]|uniref:GDSL-like Lipase/Acylhydrolase family protein n=1 Tax=Microlunatus aurantiacus TaxID=446786 RepID=A0ABP7DQW2_9ACTN
MGVAAVGILGAASLYFLWDPEKSYDPAPNTATSAITVETLEQASESRVFFGHMSVGNNVLSGVSEVYAAKGVTGPKVVEIPVGGSVPTKAGEGALVHALIGQNGHPRVKLANFDSTLRSGVADQVDVALIKFCYVDIRWNTDVDALFAEYKQTMAGLERDFPDVRFLHATAPLTVGPEGIKDHIKLVLGRDDNAARSRYNALIRSNFDDDQVFDLAAVEATAPDGETLPSLYPGYSSDGEHLNASGASKAAVLLLETVAQSGRA